MSQKYINFVQPALDQIESVFPTITSKIEIQEVISEEDMKIILANPHLIHLHQSVISFYQINQPYTVTWEIPNKASGSSQIKPFNELQIVSEDGTDYYFIQQLKYATVLLHLLSGVIYFVPLFEQCKNYKIIQAFNSIGYFYEYQASMYYIDGWELPFLGINYTATIRHVLLRVDYSLLNVIDNSPFSIDNKHLDKKIKHILKNAQVHLL